MITFLDSKEKMEDDDSFLDCQLWHACAGGTVQMPAVNSKVFYFPQGHAEHANRSVDFKDSPQIIPPFIPSKVCAVKFMADPETDEVYAKIRLLPLAGTNNALELGSEEIEEPPTMSADSKEKPASFAKTLTQSDANNGGGFSVPRYCAETIFPRLDYSADPPVQTILAKDVHGVTWKFRHIYRGTPRRHLLTTGWSTFVNHKKLIAGDSVVFLRTDNGDLCLGIRRAKRGSDSPPSGWNPFGSDECFREDKISTTQKRKVRGESVLDALYLATRNQIFEVVYYPRTSTPEFCIKTSLVEASLQIRWCSGMRFKMPFETEDSSRISWFMGTVSSVQVVDPVRWPDSPWRLLQVTWDEPDLLQNVRRVSPWLVELVSHLPTLTLPPFPSSPIRKRPRLQIPAPISGLPLATLTHQISAGDGIQGARHGQYGLCTPNFSTYHYPSLSFPPPPPSHNDRDTRAFSGGEEDASCMLGIGINSETSVKRAPPQFVLFGQPILTEQQMAEQSSFSELMRSSRRVAMECRSDDANVGLWWRELS